MAPASTSSVGAGLVGSTTARPGRMTPGSDRSRSRAVATTPPVDPADTTASAWPRRTSWHAMAALDRGRRRLARAPSSMARESSAASILTWPRGAGRSAPFRALAGASAASNGLSCA